MADVQTTLVSREQHAQEGVLQFAEEMKAIREEKLYPNAGKKDAWRVYCETRWGMSEQAVGQTIAALPVLKRVTESGAFSVPTMTAAAAVASLPEDVQDAILADSPKRDVVKARAKAARAAVAKAEHQGRVPESQEVTAAALKALPAKPRSKPGPLPAELKNLPPKLTPEDHGCAARKHVGKANLELWQANESLKDDVPDAEDREAILDKCAKASILVRQIEASVRGESEMLSDEDFAELLGGAA